MIFGIYFCIAIALTHSNCVNVTLCIRHTMLTMSIVSRISIWWLLSIWWLEFDHLLQFAPTKKHCIWQNCAFIQIYFILYIRGFRSRLQNEEANTSKEDLFAKIRGDVRIFRDNELELPKQNHSRILWIDGECSVFPVKFRTVQLQKNEDEQFMNESILRRDLEVLK